jgi:aminoglycoside phosphotransferase (APT) family kinase protein
VRRTLGAKDRRAIARALGRALAEMHELTWPTVGRYVPESGTVEAFVMEQEIRFPMEGRKRPAAGTPPPTDAERVVAVIRALVGAARRMNPHTTDEDAAWTESIIESARDALEVPIEPRFVMQDYQEGNVVVERDGADEWRVSGVFDLGGAYFGDCEADLHRMLCVYLDEDAELAREFVRTYLKLRPPRAGFDERFPAYMLLDRLIIWEYVQRTQPKVASRMGSLRAWAGRYTAALPSLR